MQSSPLLPVPPETRTQTSQAARRVPTHGKRVAQQRKEAPLSLERLAYAGRPGWSSAVRRGGMGWGEGLLLTTRIDIPASTACPAFYRSIAVANSAVSGAGLGLESQLYHL